MNYSYNIHNIVKIDSNIPVSSDYFRVEWVSDPDLVIRLKKEVNFSKKGLSRLDYWFYGKEGEDIVYYEDIVFGVKNKVLLKNLDEKTEVYVTKPTLRLDRFYPPRSRRSFSDLIDTIIRIKQIEKSFLNIHASCLSKDGSAILLAAFPQMGKTLSTIQLLKDGFNYISDDTVLVDSNGNSYLTPSDLDIHYDSLKFINKKEIGTQKYYKILLKTWLMKKSRFINRLLKPPKINLLDIEDNEMTRKSRVEIACCLEIGERQIKEVSKEYLAKKILVINAYSLPRIYTNPFVWVYSYFNDFDVNKINGKEKENLLGFLYGCNCYSLACNDQNWISLFKDMEVV